MNHSILLRDIKLVRISCLGIAHLGYVNNIVLHLSRNFDIIGLYYCSSRTKIMVNLGPFADFGAKG